MAPRKQTIEERLLRRRFITDDGHWLWTGAVGTHGYGCLNSPENNEYLVHRHAWAIWVGPIPAGYDVHHKCPYKLCFNSDHLELKEVSEHRRLHRTSDETCLKGHLRSEHTSYKKDGKGNIVRYCLACQREATQRRQERGGR